ncbi:MAG: cell division protein FtsQ/DivIB [bacterium]
MALVLCGCLAAGAGVGAGAKALWSWVTHSPYLSIEELEIRTGDRVSRSEVRMLADISEGDNILGFSLVDCVESIQIHPWVKKASVMRQLPDRLVIEIKERSPAAMVSMGTLYYVDRDGEIFKKVLPGDDLGYPVITGLQLRELVEDKKEVEPLIKMSLELIEMSRGSEVFPFSQVSEIHLSRVHGATLVRAGDGMRIRFGREDYQDKWLRMERTLQELSREAAKVAELDLNYEDRVTIGLREGYRVASVRGPSGEGND